MRDAFKICMKFLNRFKAMFQNKKAKKYRQTYQQQLNRHHKDMRTYSKNGMAAQKKMRMMENKLGTHNKSCPKFVNVDPLQTLFYYIAIIVAVGVILSNHAFTSTAVSNIADEYGNENTWYSHIFPILLMTFELFLTMLNLYFTQKTTDEIEKIKRKNIKKEDKTNQIIRCKLQLYGLRFVMGIMILISPMFLLATIITVDGFSSIQDSIKSSTFLALAVITDFLIVFGGVYICKSIAFIGERILKSIAFIVFHLTRWKIQFDINQCQKCHSKSGESAASSLALYIQALRQYNHNIEEYNQELTRSNQQHNLIPTLEPGPFSRNTTTFVNEQMGYEAITPPRAQQPQDQYRATNTLPSNNPVDTNQEEIDEPETEFNYFDLNIRDAEREVDGD